jgi:serine/threonine protein kinase
VLGSSDLQNSAERRVGKCLKSKWRLDEVIGLGGTAAIYAATHRNGSRVAIKVLHRHLCASERQVRRFLREAYTANLVGHAGAVRVHDDDVDGDDAFLVMELFEGTNLKDHAEANGGTLPVEGTLKLADQLLEVLEAAHARGIVHRDIKPSNLFLTRSGTLKVLDFGVARCIMPEADPQTTAEGDVIGTPAFMAPEQARGKSTEVTARADIWSVGATLFTLLSGELVHRAATSSEHLYLAMSASARSFSSVRPDFPAPLVDLIDRCLRYDPEERWPSVRALRVALREPSLVGELGSIESSSSDLGPLASDTLPVAFKEPKGRAWGVLLAAGVLTALVVLLVVAPSRDGEPAGGRARNRADSTERGVTVSKRPAERQEPNHSTPVSSRSQSDEAPSQSNTILTRENRTAPPPPTVRPRPRPSVHKTAPANTGGSTFRAGGTRPDPAWTKNAPSSNPLDWRH